MRKVPHSYVGITLIGATKKMKSPTVRNRLKIFKGIVLLGAIVCSAVFAFVSLKVGAQDQIRQTAADPIPYQEFLWDGQPYTDASPPTAQARKIRSRTSDVEVRAENGPADSTTKEKYSLSNILAGVVNPQPAIFGTTARNSRGLSHPGTLPHRHRACACTRMPHASRITATSCFYSDFSLSLSVVQISPATLVLQ